ncbi:MAG: hypothetical protein PUJ12_06230, partial [Oscillospiraceae bacterium]|nr:hypothetical protein [Oscillospiraceae bacterium]
MVYYTENLWFRQSFSPSGSQRKNYPHRIYSADHFLVLIGLTWQSGKMIVYMTNAIRWLHWRGNLRRTAGHESIKVSFRTSPQTGVGIPLVIETTFFYRWGLPRQFEN